MFQNRRLWVALALPIILGAIAMWIAGRRPQLLPLNHSPMAPIAISPDNRLVATNKGGQVDVIEVYDRTLRRSTSFRTSSIPGVWLFLPDNRTLVTVGVNMSSVPSARTIVSLWDAKVQTLELDQAAPIRTFGPEMAFGNALAITSDGKTLATGGESQILLWDVKTGRVTGKLNGARSNPETLSFSHDGKRLTASYMNSVDNAVCWDVPTHKLLWTTPIRVPDGSFDATSSAIAPDGSKVVVGTQNGRIALLDGTTGKLLHMGTMPIDITRGSYPADAARSVAFSPDSKTIVSGAWSGAALWNASDASVRSVIKGSGPVVFSPDGSLLATGAGEFNTTNGVILWKSW